MTRLTTMVLVGALAAVAAAPDELNRRERDRLTETLRRVDAFRKRVSARLLGTPVGAGL